ncbi:MAG: hypothetical protein ACK55I_36335, partial [bacterium]
MVLIDIVETGQAGFVHLEAGGKLLDAHRLLDLHPDVLGSAGQGGDDSARPGSACIVIGEGGHQRQGGSRGGEQCGQDPV